MLRLLSSNSPNNSSGGTFVSTVERILERESYWNKWKNDGCPSFVRNPEKSRLSVRQVLLFVRSYFVWERRLTYGNFMFVLVGKGI